MSWNGTVYCSVCYGTGHNSRTCEVKTEQVRQELKRMQRLALDDVDGQPHPTIKRLAASLAQRTGINPLTGAPVKRGSRSCSYCAESTHSRPRCPALKRDFDLYRRATVKQRHAALSDMREFKIGVGAMIMLLPNMWDSEAQLRKGAQPWIVGALAFSEKGYTGKRYGRPCADVAMEVWRPSDLHQKNPSLSRTLGMRKAKEIFSCSYVRGERGSDSLVTPASRPMQAPDGWLNAADLRANAPEGHGRDNFFATEKPRSRGFNPRSRHPLFATLALDATRPQNDYTVSEYDSINGRYRGYELLVEAAREVDGVRIGVPAFDARSDSRG